MFAADRGLFDEVTLENYRYIFTGEVPPAYLKSGANRTMISDAARQVPRSLWNSAQIALAALVAQLVLGAPAAFVFARYVFPGKKLTFMFLILSPLVPTVALITPIYMMLQAAGLVGTKAGIILVHAAKALPFTVLILSVFFRKMPNELFEAAVHRRLQPLPGVHRASRCRWRCRRSARPACSPSCSPMPSSCSPMVLSGDAATRPVSVVMAALARNPDVSWSLLNTAIFIAIVPTLVLVVLVWRYVVEDLVRGAVKG